MNVPRVQEVVDAVVASGAFEVIAISVDAWRGEGLPELDRDGVLVGVTWSGANATGDALSVADVLRNIDARAQLDRQPAAPPPASC